MIILEPTVEQIINEEGQLILSLDDLGITWETLEKLFIGTYEQSKGYLTVYDWDNKMITSQMKKQEDYTHIRHITYNAYNNMQRFMPDMAGQYWEFNPYNKNMASLIATNFSLEVGKYPTLEHHTHTFTFNNVKKGQDIKYSLPFIPGEIEVSSSNGLVTEPLDITVSEITIDNNGNDHRNHYLTKIGRCCICNSASQMSEIMVDGEITGNFDIDSSTGYFKPQADYDTLIVKITSKYKGIRELDLTCELFYVWFKANMLTMIGRVKKQIDMSQSGLPFDLSQDGILERGNELIAKVEELKTSKQHWSNF